MKKSLNLYDNSKKIKATISLKCKEIKYSSPQNNNPNTVEDIHITLQRALHIGRFCTSVGSTNLQICSTTACIYLLKSRYKVDLPSPPHVVEGSTVLFVFNS